MKLSLFLVLWAVASAHPQSDGQSTKSSKKTEARQAASILTGCLDQRGETYVLRSTDDMARVTTLEGKGFSNDNFARYVGQQVKVQGKATSGGAFEVKKIEKVAQACSQ